MTTRKTYELPAPTTSRRTYSTWFTGHSIELDGNIDNDGIVTHYPWLGIIAVDAHEDKDLDLDYNEAKRVALVLLAAVEEAETMKENTP